MNKFFKNKIFLISGILLISLLIGLILKEGVAFALSDNKDTDNKKPFIEKILDFISISDKEKVKSFQEISLEESNIIKNDSLYINDFKVPNEGKAVVANLDEKNIKIYQDGSEVSEYKIIAIGKEADSSETTPGKFEILSKETNHFSRISKVWMPYSMQFFGNFFIHGWPYDINGIPISSKDSGGCIRIKTSDAAKLFSFVEIGTPVILTGSNSKNSSENENNRNKMALYDDVISASSYLVANLDTGEVLFEKNSNKVRPIYSITKFMTALVYIETLNQKSNAYINNSVFIDELEESNLKSGNYIKMKDLVYPLLMQSSNIAANIIAENGGKDRIIESMNKRAIAFGLKNTNFVDTSGKSSDNVSTAEDVFKLIKYLSNYKNYLIDISLKKEFKSSPYVWDSKSPYLDEKWYAGGIMNYSEDKNNSGVFLINKEDVNNGNYAIILLDSDSIKNDIDLILDLL